ncbi:MAG: hypothetical protein K8T26_04385 [Lentisphaerae bacterium]|nr:hypothetical protein [Lentisphaerota bacterium]
MDTMSNSGNNQNQFSGGRRLALGLGVAGLAICLGLGLSQREAAMEAYLLAYLYWTAVALGCFSLLLLQYVSGGRWGLAIRRFLEAGASTLPLMAVLFIPILMQLKALYPWADPEVVAHDELIQMKVAYLNPTAFAIRTAVYFAVWIIISRLVIRWSRKLDAGDDPAIEARTRRLSAPALVIYSLTVTFAAFDWGMSLEPHWFSTIYGVIYAAGGALAALTLSTVVLSRVGPKGPHAAFMKPETIGDLGNLMLAFTMFWTYVSLSQFLIIWSGHLPEETPWYYVRLHGGWQWVGLGLLGMQFGLPFLLLLSRDRKRNLNRLAGVAIFILVMRYIDLYWLIVPAFTDTLRLRVLDVVAMAGIGGIWFAVYLRSLASAPLLPVRLTRDATGGGDHHG